MSSNEQWIEEQLTPDDFWRHRVTKVLAHCQTPFQEMHVVESGVYGKALVLDHRWQTCTGDEFLYHEPLVHIPFLMQGDPRRVLIAGGADGGAAREALKWKNLSELLLVDIDAAAVEACWQWLPEIHQGSLRDPRVRIEIGDAFDVIQNTHDWDVIIADLTDPIESGPAYKLFTQEFFKACSKALAPGGVFINQAGSMAPPLLGPLARVTKTIGTVFQEVRVIGTHVPTYGSPWGLVLASDKPLSAFPHPVRIDQLLQRTINGSLRMLDGSTVVGMLQTPKYVRDRVAAETVVYTLSNPPQLTR